MSNDLIQQIAETQHIDAGNANGFAESKLIELIKRMVQTEVIHFIHNKQNRLARFPEKKRNIPVVIRKTVAGISKKTDDIRHIHGYFRLFTHL